MAWTSEDLAALQAAIATGAKRVTYSDKTVEYRDLAEMNQILTDMKTELGIAPRRRRYAQHSKGIY